MPQAIETLAGQEQTKINLLDIPRHQWTSPNFNPQRISAESVGLLASFNSTLIGIDRQKKVWEDASGITSVLEKIQNNIKEIRSHANSHRNLGEILPEVLGAASYIAEQKLGYSPRVNQLQAVIALVKGKRRLSDKDILRIAVQLQTGEGKTLVSALTAISYTMMGEKTSVFVATSLDQLARHDLNEIGPLYQSLGLTVSYIAPNGKDQYIYDPNITNNDGYHFKKINTRSEAYRADIVYGETSEFAFDFMRDTTELFPENIRQVKGRQVIIQDEADRVMIDDAINPQQMELMAEREEPALQINNNIYTPREVHEILSKVVKMLDDEDVDINEDIKNINLKNHGNSITEKRADGHEYVILRQKTEEELEEMLRNVRLLNGNQSIQDIFSSDEITHLMRGFKAKGIFRLTEYLQAFHLLESRISSPTSKGVKKVLVHTYLSSINSRVLEYYLQAALHSKYFTQKNIYYRVTNDADASIELLEPLTGRDLTGRRLGHGIHEAIEAREGVEIRNESETISTLIMQEFFAEFNYVTGLTATATSRAEEFKNEYDMDVVEIPPHIKEQHRIDDVTEEVYPTQDDKFRAIVMHGIIPFLIKMGQSHGENDEVNSEIICPPMLIAFRTQKEVQDFEQFWEETVIPFLEKQKIPFNYLKIRFLSAYNRKLADEYFREAGMANHILVSDMAGRGVDWQLGGEKPKPSNYGRLKEYEEALERYNQQAEEEYYAPNLLSSGGAMPVRGQKTVEEFREDLKTWQERRNIVNNAGGVRVYGEHGSYEDDVHLRGRTARNGDHGYVRFFSSLEDQLFMEHPGELKNLRIRAILHGDDARRLILHAQKLLYVSSLGNRTFLQEQYFPVPQARNVFLTQRTEILNATNIEYKIYQYINTYIDRLVDEYEKSPEVLSKTNVDDAIERLFIKFASIFRLDINSIGANNLRSAMHTNSQPVVLLTQLQKEALNRYNSSLTNLEDIIAHMIKSDPGWRQKYGETIDEIDTEVVKRLRYDLKASLLTVLDQQWNRFIEDAIILTKHNLNFPASSPVITNPTSELITNTQLRFMQMEQDILEGIFRRIYFYST